MPPGTRVVRKTPFLERVRSWFNLADLLLWLSEELNSQDWVDFDRKWSNTLGVGLNLLFVILRINSTSTSDGEDFLDDENTVAGLIASFCFLLSLSLISISVLNAISTLTRTKQYRLFNADVNRAPSAVSAKRVKVDSAPAAASPLRYLGNALSSENAENRAHADESDHVWEISVWDPLPMCLRLFVLFSPGHVLITWLFLPYTASDPRPSITIVKTLALCALLSLQGHFLQKRFTQQSKDSIAIFSEVNKEYDSKFVQPHAHKRAVRDVGIQFPNPSRVWDESQSKWTATPEVVSTKPYQSPTGFQTRPNQAYAAHYDRYNLLNPSQKSDSSQQYITPNVRHAPSHYSTGNGGYTDMSSPIRPQNTLKPFPSPEKQRYSHAGTGTGDGGSLGVFSHAASPLRKTASANLLRQGPAGDLRRREGSPLKRTSTPAGGLYQRFGQN